MHIVLADDHDLVREGLRIHVQAVLADATISEAASCAEVLAFANQAPLPDMILLDLDMPGMRAEESSGEEGIHGVRTVIRAFPEVPVVVVSAYGDAATVAAALRSGVRGFVPKTSGSKTLGSALQKVLQGEVFVPEIPLSTPCVVPPDAPLRKVSVREAMVLRLLATGLTNREIGLQLGVKEITVKVHLQHAYRKIGAANRADAVRIVLQAAARPGLA
jgi:DNA-binding NarL/FixJ family response regulator